MLNTKKILTSAKAVNCWLKDNFKDATDLDHFVEYIRLSSLEKIDNSEMYEWAINDLNKKLILYKNKYSHLLEHLNNQPCITFKQPLKRGKGYSETTCSIEYYIFHKYGQDIKAIARLFKS